MACLFCHTKAKFQQQQSYLASGKDQRSALQWIGGAFSSRYSKDAVNQRKFEQARQELESLSARPGKQQKRSV